MPMIPFKRSALPAQAWKNGGGVTREVLCVPPGSDLSSFDWRVSIAHIASSGPFSSFEGVARSITLLSGSGVRLYTPDAEIDHRLDAPLEPFAFSGDAPVHADLLGQPCDDFNVMWRRSTCAARVQVQRGPVTLPTSEQGLLMVVSGAWHVQTDHITQLDTDDGLWWLTPVPACSLVPLHAEAAMIVVLIDATEG